MWKNAVRFWILPSFHRTVTKPYYSPAYTALRDHRSLFSCALTSAFRLFATTLFVLNSPEATRLKRVLLGEYDAQQAMATVDLVDCRNGWAGRVAGDYADQGGFQILIVDRGGDVIEAEFLREGVSPAINSTEPSSPK